MMTKEVKNVENRYVFGNGKIAVGSGKNMITDSPTVTISKIENAVRISTDLMPLDIEEMQTIVLEFKNMAGFKVFEEMVKKTKKQLKEKEKLIK